MSQPNDIEMDVIGDIILATRKGEAANLDSGSWRRIMDYAISLCSSAELKAAGREAEVQKQARMAAREAKGPIDKTQQPGWHVLGHRSRRKPKAA